MRSKAEVDKIKVDGGKVYVKWKGGSKYLLIEDQEIAIAFMWMVVNKKSGQERQIDGFIK